MNANVVRVCSRCGERTDDKVGSKYCERLPRGTDEKTGHDWQEPKPTLPTGGNVLSFPPCAALVADKRYSFEQLLNHGYISLIETWGSDQRIVESARQSTDKGFLGWPGDEKLLQYLADHKHSTPFEFAGATIELQAPILVFREWHRHRTQSYSEMSARYVQMKPLWYVPSAERLQSGGQSKTNRQASGEAATFDVPSVQQAIELQCANAFATYEQLIAAGVAREIARTVLPVGTYSRMRATGNLLNWIRFLTLRTAPEAQWEIRQYANVLADMLRGAFPRTSQVWSPSVPAWREG